ncbi:MAG: substrate-binding domain-containing protein [Capsulimonadaceae bacterium]|nr:substrate-binding domain-containing protein [Capsulimonadaceae bacterium]
MSSGSDQKDALQISPPVEDVIAAFVREQAGRRLPGERELSVRFAISRPRLRAILRDMQASGLVEARQGSGTYAIDPSRPRLHTIALLVDEQLKLGNDPYFSHLFENLQRACQAARLHCNIRRIGGEPTPAQALFDGAVTIGLAGRRIVTDHASGSVPIVALTPGIGVRPKGRVSVVQFDDRGAGRVAVSLLIDDGCRRVVFVGRLDLDASRERYEGIREACEAAHVELRAIECSLNYLAGLEMGRRLAGEEPPEAGLIAMNDWLAAGLRGGLDSRGARLKYPIISFDGLPVAAEPSLGIRSLRIPVELIANDAVAELVRLHASRASSGRTLLYELELMETAVL